MSQPLIVNFTPTGMIRTKQMTAHVAVSVSEIAEDVHKAFDYATTVIGL